jgi:radical S-adenosyl methionine domain-containing protein 2
MYISKNIHPYPNAIFSRSQIPTVDQLVINWHLTEACNYSCRYCYSSWGKSCDTRELFRNEGDARTLLAELSHFFSPSNHLNPLAQRLVWRKLRLSLVGGEPLLYPDRAFGIIQEAKRQGFDVSLITNASMLTGADLSLLEHLSILGISLDSADERVCREIGRVDRSGQVLNLENLVTILQKTRSANPDISIKINTVVNQLNWEEDFTNLIGEFRPDKWKVLRVLPLLNDELAVTQYQYDSFLERHHHLRNVMSAEDNHEMTESYLMVDPKGRFFQNRSNSEDSQEAYLYSAPILQVGADVAFRQIGFDAQKFADRYSKESLAVVA